MPQPCPQMLSTGQCPTRSCAYGHDFHLCDPCGRLFTSLASFKDHIASKNHQDFSNAAWLRCRLCDKYMCGTVPWQAHISSDRHRKKAKERSVSPKVQPETVRVVPGQTFCGLCSRNVEPKAWKSHLQSKGHRAFVSAEVFRSGLDKAETDKGGVFLSGTTDFGVVKPQAAKSGKTTPLAIRTKVTGGKIMLVDIYTIAAKAKRKTSFTVTEFKTGHRQLTVKKPIILTLTAKQRHIGRSEDRLVLVFEDSSTNTRFLIARPLSIIVGDASDHQALQPKVPYVSKTSAVRHLEKEVVPGEPAPKSGRIPWVVSLPKSAIPADLLGTLQNEEEPLSSRISTIRKGFMPNALTAATYTSTFKYLLWIEEFKME
ncbi:hypothetical protein VNI00_006198 [Paramarasmius palmivorus]|uniref:C2H2-type domain-containing protein n=1 Tax=Paramarasmius palmivorus TaxID=297713 RepID=A0AAW0D9R9_9AGAR